MSSSITCLILRGAPRGLLPEGSREILTLPLNYEGSAMKIRGTRYRSLGLHRMWRWIAAGALTAMAQLAFANSEYLELWGPAVGTEAPLLAADDQDGNRQTLESLTGPNGLLLVFSRSVDW